MDYQSNSKKSKGEGPKPKKNVTRVTTGEVIIQKKSMGRKFKDIFVMADMRSVFHYIVGDVLLPAMRNTIVDASSKGIERMMYGEQASRRRSSSYGSGTRFSYNSQYNNPINRGYSSTNAPNNAPPVQVTSRSRRMDEEYLLSSREDAAEVLERMSDLIDTYDVVSVADLNELIGNESSHTDNKWGWTFLGNVRILTVRDGYLIDLPNPEPIQ